MEFQPEDVPGWALIHVARYSGVGEDVLETEKPIFIPLAVDDKSG